MIDLTEVFWRKTLVVFTVLVYSLGGVHIGGDVINHDTIFAVNVFVVSMGVIYLAQLFATIWSWAGKWYGYVILGGVSVVNFCGYFLFHVLELFGVQSFSEIANDHPALWQPLYVTCSIYAGVLAFGQILITLYLLYKLVQANE